MAARYQTEHSIKSGLKLVEDAGNGSLTREGAVQLRVALAPLLLELDASNPSATGLWPVVDGHDPLYENLGLCDGAESGHGGFDHHLLFSCFFLVSKF